MLPNIIIKRILKYLINDYKYLYNYLYISKYYFNYILSKIESLQLVNINQIKSISKIKLNSGSSSGDGGDEYLKDNIKKIILILNSGKGSGSGSDSGYYNTNQLQKKDLNIFSNLRNITINVYSGTTSYNSEIISYITSNYNYKFKNLMSLYYICNMVDEFSNMKKLEIKSRSSTSLSTLNTVLESSLKLKSIDISISTFFASLDFMTMTELDLNQDEEREEAISSAIRLGQLLKESNLKKLSLRDPNVYIENLSNYKSTHLMEQSYLFLLETLNNYISISNISKLHLYGIMVKPHQLFNSLSQASSKIKKLKLVSINLNEPDIYNEFIQYLLNVGHNTLTKLSIRNNKIYDNDDDDNNNQFINYIQKSNCLSKLDISFNSFNNTQLFNEIINHHTYQYSTIKISHLNKSLLKLLSDHSKYINHTTIKLIYNNHNHDNNNSIIINHQYLINNSLL